VAADVNAGIFQEEACGFLFGGQVDQDGLLDLAGDAEPSVLYGGGILVYRISDGPFQIDIGCFQAPDIAGYGEAAARWRARRK